MRGHIGMTGFALRMGCVDFARADVFGSTTTRWEIPGADVGAGVVARIGQIDPLPTGLVRKTCCVNPLWDRRRCKGEADAEAGGGNMAWVWPRFC